MLRTVFNKYIEAVIDKSPDKLSAVFSTHGRLQLPFRRGRETISGRENIRHHYSVGFSIVPLRFTSIEDIRFHYSKDPTVAIVEYKLNGYTQPQEKYFYCLYINVITVINGELIELIDYEDVLNRADTLS